MINLFNDSFDRANANFSATANNTVIGGPDNFASPDLGLAWRDHRGNRCAIENNCLVFSSTLGGGTMFDAICYRPGYQVADVSVQMIVSLDGTPASTGSGGGAVSILLRQQNLETTGTQDKEGYYVTFLHGSINIGRHNDTGQAQLGNAFYPSGSYTPGGSLLTDGREYVCTGSITGTNITGTIQDRLTGDVIATLTAPVGSGGNARIRDKGGIGIGANLAYMGRFRVKSATASYTANTNLLANVPNLQAGTQQQGVVLNGIGTNWLTSNPAFSLSGAAGVTLVSGSISIKTNTEAHLYVNVASNAAGQTVTITDPSQGSLNTTAIPVVAPTASNPLYSTITPVPDTATTIKIPTIPPFNGIGPYSIKCFRGRTTQFAVGDSGVVEVTNGISGGALTDTPPDSKVYTYRFQATDSTGKVGFSAAIPARRGYSLPGVTTTAALSNILVASAGDSNTHHVEGGTAADDVMMAQLANPGGLISPTYSYQAQGGANSSWYDPNSGSGTNKYAGLIAALQAGVTAGKTVIVTYNLGTNDTFTKAQYKTYVQNFLTALAIDVPTAKVVLQTTFFNPGQGDSSKNTSLIEYRDAHEEIVASGTFANAKLGDGNAIVHTQGRGDLFSDGVPHLSASGNDAIGKYAAQGILSNLSSPTPPTIEDSFAGTNNTFLEARSRTAISNDASIAGPLWRPVGGSLYRLSNGSAVGSFQLSRNRYYIDDAPVDNSPCVVEATIPVITNKNVGVGLVDPATGEGYRFIFGHTAFGVGYYAYRQKDGVDGLLGTSTIAFSGQPAEIRLTHYRDTATHIKLEYRLATSGPYTTISDLTLSAGDTVSNDLWPCLELEGSNGQGDTFKATYIAKAFTRPTSKIGRVLFLGDSNLNQTTQRGGGSFGPIPHKIARKLEADYGYNLVDVWNKSLSGSKSTDWNLNNTGSFPLALPGAVADTSLSGAKLWVLATGTNDAQAANNTSKANYKAAILAQIAAGKAVGVLKFIAFTPAYVNEAAANTASSSTNWTGANARIATYRAALDEIAAADSSVIVSHVLNDFFAANNGSTYLYDGVHFADSTLGPNAARDLMAPVIHGVLASLNLQATSATIPISGDVVEITLDKPAASVGAPGTWNLTVAGAPRVVTNATLPNPNLIRLNLASLALPGQAATISGGSAVDANGVSLFPLSNVVVTNMAADVTPPTVPTLNNPVPSNAQISLSWVANTDDTTGYELDNNGVTIDVGNTLSYNDTGLTNDIQRSYRVRAYDAAGNRSNWSAAQSATPSGASPGPTPYVEVNVKIPTQIFQRALNASVPTSGAEKLSDIIASLAGFTPIVYPISIPNAARDTDVTVLEKIRVIDAWFVKTAATGVGSVKTVTLKNGTTAITNALDVAVTDMSVVRASTINDAAHVVQKGGVLRATATKSGQDCSGILYVKAIRVP